MREIEFRAWIPDLKRIYKVKHIDFFYKLIEFEEEGKLTDTKRMLDQVELMQYTGIKDKDGTKIFENDIVRVNDEEENGIIEFDVNTCGCMIFYGNYYRFLTQQMKIKVVGNIYENSELLVKMQ